MSPILIVSGIMSLRMCQSAIRLIIPVSCNSCRSCPSLSSSFLKWQITLLDSHRLSTSDLSEKLRYDYISGLPFFNAADKSFAQLESF